MASSGPQSAKRKKRNASQQQETAKSLVVEASPGSPHSGRSSSPDQVCSICLGKPESKCFSNSCLHEFCFRCLLEWSKVKAECPLCKQPFSSIIHNVRSNHEYDEHKIPPPEPEEPDFASLLGGVHHRFRYRTTLTQERRALLAVERLEMLHFNQFREAGVLPRPLGRPRMRRSRLTGTSTFRRQVYQRDLWVRPLTGMAGRYRDTTPEFFQLNPAMTHRLVPWLNRELNVLLVDHENRLPYVLQLILRLIEQHPIRSRPFRDALSQYMGANTEHFVHEFYQYARSPYDMYGFDENAHYQSRADLQLQHEEVAVSESSGEEEEEETVARPLRMEPRDIPLPPSPQPGPSGVSNSRAAFTDDGQSYSAVTARPTWEEDDEEDVEVLAVVRPSTPEVITLSDTSEDEEEEPATSTSSRGKALKRHRDSPRRDKRHRSKKKKSTSSSKRERPASPERPRDNDEEEEEEDYQPPRTFHQVRYWEMDPEEIRHQLRSGAGRQLDPGGAGDSGSSSSGSRSKSSRSDGSSSSSKQPHKRSGRS